MPRCRPGDRHPTTIPTTTLRTSKERKQPYALNADDVSVDLGVEIRGFFKWSHEPYQFNRPVAYKYAVQLVSGYGYLINHA